MHFSSTACVLDEGERRGEGAHSGRHTASFRTHPPKTRPHEQRNEEGERKRKKSSGSGSRSRGFFFPLRGALTQINAPRCEKGLRSALWKWALHDDAAARTARPSPPPPSGRQRPSPSSASPPRSPGTQPLRPWSMTVWRRFNGSSSAEASSRLSLRLPS